MYGQRFIGLHFMKEKLKFTLNELGESNKFQTDMYERFANDVNNFKAPKPTVLFGERFKSFSCNRMTEA